MEEEIKTISKKEIKYTGVIEVFSCIIVVVIVVLIIVGGFVLTNFLENDVVVCFEENNKEITSITYVNDINSYNNNEGINSSPKLIINSNTQIPAEYIEGNEIGNTITYYELDVSVGLFHENRITLNKDFLETEEAKQIISDCYKQNDKVDFILRIIALSLVFVIFISFFVIFFLKIM